MYVCIYTMYVCMYVISVCIHVLCMYVCMYVCSFCKNDFHVSILYSYIYNYICKTNMNNESDKMMKNMKSSKHCKN